MNRFFTILSAGSCLTAAGQTDFVPDSVLIDEGWSLVLEREGQQYWLFDEDREWGDARAMCEELGAYLYWPNSLEEHLEVWASVPNGNDGVHYWTAIHQDFSQVDCASDEGWAGPNGEPQTFFHWDDGQPNNVGGESVVQFEWSDWGATWNDAPGQACDGNPECSCRMSRVILERTSLIEGCIDQNACNYDAEAACDDGSCDYSCCPGPGCCDVGTEWSWESNTCIVANPSDSNFDGCVQLNDLLDLLSTYGGCEAEASPWLCGDPLEYQGYDYATVQIGEQCWFAENLRATQFRDGEDLVVADDAQGWMSLEGQGVVALYESASEVQGHFYSLPAVLHESGICPSGWKVPSDSDWAGLEIEIGMPEEELGNFGYRGVAELIGLQLKSTSGWPEGGNGTDAFGFEGRPAGAINDNDGQHNEQEIISRWWSSTPENATLISRYLRSNEVGFRRLADGTALDGFSIRCLKNFE